MAKWESRMLLAVLALLGAKLDAMAQGQAGHFSEVASGTSAGRHRTKGRCTRRWQRAHLVMPLSVRGVGRLQGPAPGVELSGPAKPIDVAALLEGGNWEAAPLALHKKVSLVTQCPLIEGFSAQLPFVALNAHLHMPVASRVMPTANCDINWERIAKAMRDHAPGHQRLATYCRQLATPKTSP